MKLYQWETKCKEKHSIGGKVSPMEQTYKEPSIISGTGAAIWSETNVGPTGHHLHRSSHLLPICTVPSTSAIFLNASWKSCSVSVQHCLLFCLDHLICVKMAAFQFYLQSRKQRTVGWVGVTVMLLPVKNSLVKKGIVRLCTVMMQQSVLLLPKFGAKSWHVFMQSS
jgi:hypothetical protein